LHQDHDSTDILLDTALASYADPPDSVDPGLIAARILVAIAAIKSRSRWRFAIALSLAASACAVIVLLAMLPWPSVRPPALGIAYSLPSVAKPVSPRVAAIPVRHRMSSSVVRKSRNRPKLDRFPAPVPVSAQEHLLIQFADHATPRAKEAVETARNKLDETLGITELEIQPLEMKDRQ
jgi:hypothetical protein